MALCASDACLAVQLGMPRDFLFTSLQGAGYIDLPKHFLVAIVLADKKPIPPQVWWSGETRIRPYRPFSHRQRGLVYLVYYFVLVSDWAHNGRPEVTFCYAWCSPGSFPPHIFRLVFMLHISWIYLVTFNTWPCWPVSCLLLYFAVHFYMVPNVSKMSWQLPCNAAMHIVSVQFSVASCTNTMTIFHLLHLLQRGIICGSYDKWTFVVILGRCQKCHWLQTLWFTFVLFVWIILTSLLQVI